MNFTDTNPETILAETLSRLELKLGYKLSEADVERIMVDVSAYRELLLRIEMNRNMRNNFVQFADSQALDHWGELYGIPRGADESDEAYRKRILTTYSTVATGTKATYLSKLLAFQGISDIDIISRNDDVTIPPGIIHIYPIVKYQDSDKITQGVLADDAFEQSLLSFVNDENFLIVGDLFEIKKPRIIPVNGTIRVRSIIGTDRDALKQNIEFKLKEYFASISLKFDSAFGVFDLEKKLLEVDGISVILDLDFPNIPSSKPREFYQKGEINLTIE